MHSVAYPFFVSLNYIIFMNNLVFKHTLFIFAEKYINYGKGNYLIESINQVSGL